MPRIPNDAYYTPDSVAEKCVAVIADDLYSATILEPAAGGGAFVRAARRHAKKGFIVGADIDPDAAGIGVSDHGVVGDYLAEPFSHNDWIIGNPPYNQAVEFCSKALGEARIGVAFLLRLGFLASQRRAAFWSQSPPSAVHVLRRRPFFTGGGTDSQEYAFYVWRRGFEGAPTLYWI